MKDVDEFEKRVNNVVLGLQRGLFGNASSARARIARLRSAEGSMFGEVPEIWDLEGECLPDRILAIDDMRAGGDVTAFQNAAHVALCGYAVSQQLSNGQAAVRRRRLEGTFGRAVHAAAMAQRADGAMPDAFRLTIVSQDFDELSRHLLHTLRFVGSHGKSLDFGHLAGQVARWHRRSERAGVVREWGHEWASYRVSKSGKEDAGQE